MGYTLLTGVTGLLGEYLLRDLLVRDERLAVVVRPSRQETPEQRVDNLLSRWENQWGRKLPRPVVFRGDITEPLLGLEANERDWLRRHCERVLHSAASLTFYEKGGEPWRTNVDGLRNMLDLCRDTNIRLLEHVSSAYVCGLGSGRFYESQLDVGQEYGNDYEKSKVAAEQLVRSDSFLEGFTIYRPSIIVGDSQTGYSSTFHGFYSPLRVAAALLSSTDLGDALQVDYLSLLGLEGNERKNFIPVDWVSEAMVAIRARTVPQGATYMLASEHPVTVRRMHAAFEECVLRFHQEAGAIAKSKPVQHLPQNDAATTSLFERLYVEHFAVYRSYWRDDPDFDSSNTRAVLPDLPPHEVTDEMLRTLSLYALESNFGFPPPRFEALPFSVRDWMRRHGTLDRGNGTRSARSSLGITVTGPGGGCWALQNGDATGFRYGEGWIDVATEARMTHNTFQDLVSAQITLDEAIDQGRVVVFGDPSGIQRLRSFVRHETSTAET